jgi:hypothetical protein
MQGGARLADRGFARNLTRDFVFKVFLKKAKKRKLIKQYNQKKKNSSSH